MDIRSARFVKAVTGTEGLPDTNFPVIAFFGRSNVGKSSVINSLVRQKKLAYSSTMQGRTTAINYFLINDAFYFVDLPGYGYARRSRAQQIKIGKQLSWFVSETSVPIRYFILIIDAEIGPKDSDRKTYELLESSGHDILLVANKADKGKRNDVTKHLASIEKEFPGSPVIRYSAKTNEGREKLLSLLLG